MTTDRGDAAVLSRRLARLRDELVDLEVPLPVDAPGGGRELLEEIDYARSPEIHEGRAHRYGAIVSFGVRPSWERLSAPTRLESAGVALPQLRKMADGRAAFVVRLPEAPNALVCFDRSLEYESSAVRLRHETNAFVVQRTGLGLVRVCGPEGVVTWDGVQWSFKPLAEHHVAPIRRLVPQVDATVLAGLLGLCVHWLSAGRVGATVVLSLRDDAEELGNLDFSRGVSIPPLRPTHIEHLPPLLSLLAQTDRAAVAERDGGVSHVDVGLYWSARTGDLIEGTGGMRHTSARRYSYEEPDALVFVVSADGPVSVFYGGAEATTVAVDPCQSGFPVTLLGNAVPDPEGEMTTRCPGCGRLLLLDVIRFDAWSGGPERLPCPVCAETIVADAYRAAIKGVLREPVR